ncbi:hypothetical protein CEXT_717331 [Caerostris extrusa]|uniref:Uncharacterized protein n=1 Tax=Caerostris extrusa TaxID=172846 RepID=A0AAV4Y0X8_CAEEX|nr:hypothetical protein CEXT_717331 [Caerostris extrusa]
MKTNLAHRRRKRESKEKWLLSVYPAKERADKEAEVHKTTLHNFTAHGETISNPPNPSFRQCKSRRSRSANLVAKRRITGYHESESRTRAAKAGTKREMVFYLFIQPRKCGKKEAEAK